MSIASPLRPASLNATAYTYTKRAFAIEIGQVHRRWRKGWIERERRRKLALRVGKPFLTGEQRREIAMGLRPVRIQFLRGDIFRRGPFERRRCVPWQSVRRHTRKGLCRLD